MSLKRKLAATTVALAAAAVPFAGVSPAHAVSTDPYLDTFNSAVDLSALQELVAQTPLCAITFVNGVKTAGFGLPVITSIYPVLSVNFTPTVTYVSKVSGVTGAFITCTLT